MLWKSHICWLFICSLSANHSLNLHTWDWIAPWSWDNKLSLSDRLQKQINDLDEARGISTTLYSNGRLQSCTIPSSNVPYSSFILIKIFTLQLISLRCECLSSLLNHYSSIPRILFSKKWKIKRTKKYWWYKLKFSTCFLSTGIHRAWQELSRFCT